MISFILSFEYQEITTVVSGQFCQTRKKGKPELVLLINNDLKNAYV